MSISLFAGSLQQQTAVVCRTEPHRLCVTVDACALQRDRMFLLSGTSLTATCHSNRSASAIFCNAFQSAKPSIYSHTSCCSMCRLTTGPSSGICLASSNQRRASGTVWLLSNHQCGVMPQDVRMGDNHCWMLCRQEVVTDQVVESECVTRHVAAPACLFAETVPVTT